MQKKGIMRQAGPLLVARGASTVLGFGLPLLLVRLLDQSSFGLYKQFWLVASNGYLMLQMGLTASLYYFLPRRDGKGAAWLSQAVLTVSVFGALGGVAVYLSRFALARHFSTPELAQFGLPMAILTFTLTASTPLEAGLLAGGEIKLSAVTNFVSELLRVVASIVPLLLGYGLHGFFWAYVIHGGLRYATCLALVVRRGGPRIDWKLYGGQLAYALPFGCAILFDTPQRNLHLWAVGGTVGAAAFAIYSQGCFQIPIVNLLYQPISDVLQVRLNEPGGRAHGVHLFHDANLRLAGLLLPFTALMISAGSLFIPGLFTHLYDASIPIFRVAVLSALFAALPLEAVLRATGLTRYMFNVFFWRLLVTAAFVFSGLHFFGMMGAISGHVVAEAMVRSAMLDRIRRELGATWSEILPWGELRNLLVASVISCAPVVAIARYPQSSARPLFALFVAGAVYGIVYLSILAFRPGAGTPIERLKRTLLGAHEEPATVAVPAPVPARAA
ncbi:MAG TPA: oligosaccharide flippase family protein [Myxococcales bacterium]|nr:oligosaccharide flippase family protein [Myxococcales bacterium]